MMYDALEAAKTDVELHIFANAPHAFDTDPGLGRQCTSLMSLFLERYGLAAKDRYTGPTQSKASASLK